MFGTIAGWITGDTAGKRNNDRRRAENRAYEAAKDQWRDIERERIAQYEFDLSNYENALEEKEFSNRFQEAGLIQNFEYQEDMRQFELEQATKAYDKSVSQATGQKTFNEIAKSAAMRQQDVKKKEDLLGIMFDEQQTLFDFKAASTGLKMDKTNSLIQADISKTENILGYISDFGDITSRRSKQLTDANIKDAQTRSKFAADIGSLAIERNEKRSQAKIATQKAILDGMKAAGALRSRGASGRSSAKTVMGVLAESGAIQANIANGLMYAEQSIDMGVAQLQDMFVADQTMVLAARNNAVMDAAMDINKLTTSTKLEDTKISAALEMELQKANFDLSVISEKYKIDRNILEASKKSIANRDKAVREQIINSKIQADLNAEASILLEPEPLPAPVDPRVLYAEYDDPETEDYVEIFFRPTAPEFPEYIPTRKPEKDDFRYMLGREDAAAQNISAGIGLASLVAGGIGTFTGETTKFLGLQGNTWTKIGNTLGTLGNYGR